MKKNFTPVHRSKLHPMNNFQMSVRFAAGFCLYIFVCINIVASQMVPALYYSFANEDRTAVAQLLRRIQHLKEYPDILASQRGIYGSSIDADIFKENQIRADNIQKLKQMLQINPKARDVLAALSVLYKESGQNELAQSYLEKAQEVDPMVK